jgi:hypothetical protein
MKTEAALRPVAVIAPLAWALAGCVTRDAAAERGPDRLSRDPPRG